jgi:hypothetical protein
MTAPQVISVGSYKFLYQDYMMAVNKYFNSYGSFNNNVFSDESAIDISGGDFDAIQFMNLINQQQDPNQNQNLAVPLTGFVTLSNINQLLRYSVDSNIFGNRNPLPNDSSSNISPVDLSINNTISFENGTVIDVSNNLIITTVFDPSTNVAVINIQDNNNNSTTVITNDINNNSSMVVTTDASLNPLYNINPSFSTTVTTTYADVSFSQIQNNFGVPYGFLAGDMIFIPAGMSALLETRIDPMIDASTSYIYDLIVNSGLAYEFAIDLSNIATQPTNIISKILTAPLLIELANLS